MNALPVAVAVASAALLVALRPGAVDNGCPAFRAQVLLLFDHVAACLATVDGVGDNRAPALQVVATAAERGPLAPFGHLAIDRAFNRFAAFCTGQVRADNTTMLVGNEYTSCVRASATAARDRALAPVAPVSGLAVNRALIRAAGRGHYSSRAFDAAESHLGLDWTF